MENGAEKNVKVEVKVEKPAAEIKTEDIKTEKADPADDTKTDDTKADESKPTETNAADAKPVKIKVEDIKSEEAEAVKTEEAEAKASIKLEHVKEEEPTSELLEKIKSQVEFYFGDINLPRDKFLNEQTKLDEGWIPMTIMLKFKLLASMSKNPEVILKALESSELIEISEDRKKIRRNPENPLPVLDEAYKKAQAERTVYVKGFPLTDIYIQKLKEFFKDYEPFENIILRKYQDKEKKLLFKGSIFIQFKTLEDAKAFMARESVKYGDTELIRKFSEDYAVEKAKEKEERKLKKGEKKDIKTEENDKDIKTEDEHEKIELPKGSILHFTGVTSGTLRESIKEQISKIGGTVAYVDFQKDDKEGWVRLQDENSGKEVIEKMDNNTLTIKNVKVTFRLLEGEEEETYLNSVKNTIQNLRNKSKYAKRGRSKRGRSSGQRGRKRHGSPAHGAVPAKKSGLD